MKIAYFVLGAALTARAFAACPFEVLKRAGKLTEADLANLEAVKRDHEVAEEIFQAHKREAAPEPSPAGVVGPIVGSRGIRVFENLILSMFVAVIGRHASSFSS